MKRPQPPHDDDITTPAEPPASTPRDLYATSDIRFVMLELGKLGAKFDHLAEDVKSIAGKLDKLRLAAAWVAGAFATIIGFVALVPPSVRERLFRAIVGD